MKIKIIAVIVIFGMIFAASTHALGIGLQGNFSTGDILAPGLAVLISPQDRTNIAVNWYIEGRYNQNIIGVTLDIVPFILQILPIGQGSFNFTLGGGLYSNIFFSDASSSKVKITGGVRVPVGFNIYLGGNVFEIFAHVAPSWGVDLTPKLQFSEKPFFPIALGGRLWFR